LAGTILSAFSMTEPEGGSDPTGLTTSVGWTAMSG
jgi:alkylation response protein AidB-like acyl-CoA dehydrogenase